MVSFYISRWFDDTMTYPIRQFLLFALDNLAQQPLTSATAVSKQRNKVLSESLSEYTNNWIHNIFLQKAQIFDVGFPPMGFEAIEGSEESCNAQFPLFFPACEEDSVKRLDRRFEDVVAKALEFVGRRLVWIVFELMILGEEGIDVGCCFSGVFRGEQTLRNRSAYSQSPQKPTDGTWARRPIQGLQTGRL